MLFISWFDGYTECYANDVFHRTGTTDLHIRIIGPNNKVYVAKLRLSVNRDLFDFDYVPFSSENKEEWDLGVVRVQTDFAGSPIAVFWKNEGDENFVSLIDRKEDTFTFDPTIKDEEFENFIGDKKIGDQLKVYRNIEARMGQSKFRDKLIYRWSGRCALTKISIKGLLQASHLKSWATPGISSEERLDSDNGLLLAAHVHNLFDYGLLTFQDDGQLIWSSVVSSEERELLNLPARLQHALNKNEILNLRHHREEKFIP